MGQVSDAKARWRDLTEEQRVLVAGQGADTRPLSAWVSLLEELAAFGEVRRRAARTTSLLLAGLLVGVAVLVLWGSVARPEDRLWLAGAAVLVAGAAIVGPWLLWLARRPVPGDLARFTLPLLRSLRDEVGGEARLWLALRFAPGSERDDRWLEGALELPEDHLLHLSARDVLEDDGVVCWLRATVSAPEQVEVHAVGEDDPSASGMTRQVAEQAAAAGDPFTSTEMLALKTAHGIQLELARAESFAAMEVPAPPIGDVVGEASERRVGGRDRLEGPDPLLALWRRAAA